MPATTAQRRSGDGRLGPDALDCNSGPAVAAATGSAEDGMPDKFDPYREALVLEEVTFWPADSKPSDSAERQRLERALHADPASAKHLEYIRLHTGFCRRIHVQAEDLTRLRAADASEGKHDVEA